MSRTFFRLSGPVILWMAPVALAQPRLQNAKLETRAVTGSLEATIHGISNTGVTAWIAYAVPQIPGDRNMCCWNDDHQGCGLEPQSGNVVITSPSRTVKLEGSTEFYVFYRIENKQIEKIRSFSPECDIDAGGLPFYWLTGANAGQSVAFLEAQLPKTDSRDERRLMRAGISAIALHRDASADAALDRLSRPPQSEETRKQAAFWLGN